MAAETSPRSVLGSLLTVFTEPPACTYAVAQCSTCSQAWSAQTCASSGVEDDPSCWPATTSGAPTPPLPLSGWGFYSPGLVCPSGYASACTATAGGVSGWDVQFPLVDGETAVGCCPSGFICSPGFAYAQTCISVPTSAVIPTVTCESGTSGGFGQLTIPNAEVTGSFTLYAPMIQINWKASDRPASFASATTTMATITATSSTAGASTTGPAANTGSSSNTTDTGAIIGIVIGVLAVVAIAGVVVLLWRRRRTGSTGRPRPPRGPQEMEASTEFARNKGLHGYSVTHEVPGNGIGGGYTGPENPVELPAPPGR